MLMQAVAVVVVALFTAVVTWIILKVVDVTVGLRVPEQEEVLGPAGAHRDQRGGNNERLLRAYRSYRRAGGKLPLVVIGKRIDEYLRARGFRPQRGGDGQATGRTLVEHAHAPLALSHARTRLEDNVRLDRDRRPIGGLAVTVHETGEPLVTMDGRLITEMRTAAVSAVATDLLARREIGVLAILGSGVQARSHLEALRLVRHFREVRVWSPRHAPEFAREHGVIASASAEEAVRGAEVIVLPNASGKVELPALMRELARRGMNEVHIEAGHKLNGSLLQEDLVHDRG